MPEDYEPTDKIKMAKLASRKRVRGATRTEFSIAADYFLAPIIDAVDSAVDELGMPVVSTDWIRHAIVNSVDLDKLTEVAHAEIMKAQLGQKQVGTGP